MRDLIFAVDVDEVCADLLTAWLGRYNQAYGDNLTLADITKWDMVSQVKPECGEDIYRFLSPDIYDEVLPIPGALEAVNELRAIGRVVFVTTGNGDAKLKWLRRYGFLEPGHALYDRDFICAKDKSLILADYLFDDCIENVQAFPRGAFLVPHNHNAQHPCERQRLYGQGLERAALAVQADISLQNILPF